MPAPTPGENQRRGRSPSFAVQGESLGRGRAGRVPSQVLLCTLSQHGESVIEQPMVCIHVLSSQKEMGFLKARKINFSKIKIEKVDERFTTVAAHRTMNILDINKKQKKNIVDTISAVYILEMFINRK